MFSRGDEIVLGMDELARISSFFSFFFFFPFFSYFVVFLLLLLHFLLLLFLILLVFLLLLLLLPPFFLLLIILLLRFFFHSNLFHLISKVEKVFLSLYLRDSTARLCVKMTSACSCVLLLPCQRFLFLYKLFLQVKQNEI